MTEAEVIAILKAEFDKVESKIAKELVKQLDPPPEILNKKYILSDSFIEYVQKRHKRIFKNSN